MFGETGNADWSMTANKISRSALAAVIANVGKGRKAAILPSDTLTVIASPLETNDQGISFALVSLRMAVTS
ncbi:MAG: hypothetical protein QM501_02690 [Gimesia sp.]